MKTESAYTIAKLIEELKKFPQDLPVITSGYEGEYENILPPKTITVKFVSQIQRFLNPVQFIYVQFI